MRYAVLSIGLCGVASAALLARYGLNAGFSPDLLTAWRLTVASVVLILFQLVRRPLTRLEARDRWRVLLAGICLALHFMAWIGSLEYITVARSTLLVSTSPLWAGLVGLVMPSLRPRPIFWAGLLVAAIGSILVTMQGTTSVVPKGPPWIGDVLATLGAICIVPYLLLSQDVQKRTGTVVTITWIYAAAASFIWLVLVVRSEAIVPSSRDFWLSVLGMALIAQLIGHSLLNYCLKLFTAAQVTTSTLLEPVFAGLLAWLFLREPVPALQAIGGVILLIGIALSLRGERDAVAVPPE